MRDRIVIMAQAALHTRAASAASLKDSVRELTRYKQGVRPSKRLLQRKLDKLLGDKEDLVTKHYVYAEKANEDLDSEELLNWLTPKLDAANDVADETTLMIEEIEMNDHTQQKTLDDAALQVGLRNEIVVAEMQYKANERTLRDRVQLMVIVVNDDMRSTKEDANLIRNYLRQVEDSMGDQIKSWNAINRYHCLTKNSKRCSQMKRS